MADQQTLLNLLRAARPLVEEAGTISGYGYYRPENPHDFHPDPESCSDEEIANHKAACDAWDRGEYKAPEQGGWVHNEQGEGIMHILTAPWGIGSYQDMRDDAANLLAAIDAVLAASPAQLGSQAMNLSDAVAQGGGLNGGNSDGVRANSETVDGTRNEGTK